MVNEVVARQASAVTLLDHPVMTHVSNSKRTIEFPALQAKRAKKDDSHSQQTDALDAPPFSHGVDRIPFTPSVKVHKLDNLHLEEIIREHVVSIGKLGRRMVGLPIILDDGIVIHWICSTKELSRLPESEIKTSVYSAEGDRHSRLAAPSPSASWKSKYSGIPVSHKSNNITVAGTSVEDATVIGWEVDEGESSCTTRLPKCKGERCGPDPLSQDPGRGNESNDAACFVQVASNCGCVDQEGLPSNPSPRPHLVATQHGVIASDPDAVHNPVGVDDGSTLLYANLAAPSAKETIIILSDPEDSTFENSAEGSDEDDGELVENDSPQSRRRMGANHRAYSSSRMRPALASADINQDVSVGPKQHQRHLSGASSKPLSTRRYLRRSQGSSRSPEREQTAVYPDDGGDIDISLSQPKRIPLPRTQYGRSRRIAIPATVDLPLVAVTMRGDCHFIHRKEKHRITRLSLPNTNAFRHVNDVCIVDDTVVLGCDKGPHQVSFLPVSAPHIIDARHSPHSHLRHQGMSMRGVSCLAAIHAEAGHIKFVSGGHDGFIHIWAANIQALDDARSDKVAFHGSSVSALAYGRHNATLLSSAQKTILATDLNQMADVTNRFSNEIQQIHVHPQAPYMTLFEVRHLDRQILLYDSRKSTFDKEPCLSFGHRSSDTKFSPSYTRGSAHLVYFARGSEDGSVFLWDFRNTKDVVVKRRYQQAEKVVHTVFVDSDITTLGDGVVTFFERYLAG